ncbi:M48 family metalloprotease [Pontibacter sp. 13R65]
MKKHTVAAFFTAAILFLNSCSSDPVTGKKELMLLSEEQEVELGKQADPEIVAQFGLYQDPALQQFMQEKGQQMAAISHRSKLEHHFKVLDSPVINAFAVPGGYVYFTRGILAHFNNEAQFAGVLGHEIGHVAARHSAQQQSKGVLAQFGLVLGRIIAPEFEGFANAASQGVGLLFLKFGRDDERESDRLGVEYATKLGYDAAEMADFFNTLQRTQESSDGEEMPNFLSTHPASAERSKTVRQLADKWQQEANLTDAKVNRETYLKLIDGLIYGEDPKQGYVEKEVFYHPELRFRFPIPTDWRHENSPQHFQMAPKDGKAMMLLTLAQGESLEAVAEQVLKQNSLQAQQTKQVTVNGLPALAIVADQVQQQQVSLRVLTYLIQYNGNIYSIMGVASPAEFENYAPEFEHTMQNFARLTDSEKINRQAERIRIKTLSRSSTLAQALRSFQVLDSRLDELAILNGMQLDDQLSQGTMIKVVSR